MAATFNPMVITSAGLAAYAAYLQGAALTITKIAIGNGVYADSEKTTAALQQRTALKSLKNNFNIQTKEVTETTMKLRSIIRNYDPDTQQTIVAEPYYMNELGLFASANGTEFLFGIAVCSEATGDAISTYTGNNPIQIIQNITLEIDNAENITITVSPDVTANVVLYDNATSGLTATDVQAALDEIATGGGSGIEARLEECEQNILALTIALAIETGAIANGTGDNIAVETFADSSGVIIVSGSFDGVNHRLYA